MKIVKGKITGRELTEMAEEGFGDMVKAVVDVNKNVMVIDAELHSDQEALLLERGSNQKDLWGINIYPFLQRNEWVEFDSMINLRPSQNNRSRGVDDPALQKLIIEIVDKLIE